MISEVEKLLEDFDYKDFRDWKEHTFHLYAFTTTPRGVAKLGVNGNGLIIVIFDGVRQIETPDYNKAMKKYAEIIVENR